MSLSLKTWDSLTKMVKWKIHYFSPLNSRRKEITSPSFMLDKRYFQIFFSFAISASVADVQIQLLAKSSNDSRMFNFEIGIKKPNGSVCLVKDKVFACKIGGEDSSKHLDSFNFTDIECDRGVTVICMVHLKKFSVVHPKDVSTQTLLLESIVTLSENFKDLLYSGRHADVIVKVGNKEYKAHKSVLAARSTVLDSMFSSDMLENNTGVINITDTDEDTFEDFLTFMYSGKIDQVSLNKVKDLYEIADKYNLPELKRECVKRFMIEMSLESVCDALRVSTIYDEELLLKTATKFFIDNAEDVFDYPNWSLFLKDHPEVANELFKKCFKARLK